MKRSEVLSLACVIAVAAMAILWNSRLDARQQRAVVRSSPALVCAEAPPGTPVDPSSPCANENAEVQQAGEPRSEVVPQLDSALIGVVVSCGTEKQCDELIEQIGKQLADSMRSDMQMVIARMNSSSSLDLAENVCSKLEIVNWWREMPEWAVGNGKNAIVDSLGYSQYADKAAIDADTTAQRALSELGELTRLQTDWCSTNTSEAMNLARTFVRERQIPLSKVNIGLGLYIEHGQTIRSKAS